jgi:penicillin-binding protein 2
MTHIGEAWLPGDTYNMAIGQGFVLSTPLQVATVTNAVAMNGTAYRPRIVRAVVDTDRNVVRETDPEIRRRVQLRPETLAAVRDGMIGVLQTRESAPYQIPGIRVAGKTGTAEFVGPLDSAGKLPTHGWFTAFAPAEAPRVSVTVFIEKGGGPKDALPLAMDLLRLYFARYP